MRFEAKLRSSCDESSRAMLVGGRGLRAAVATASDRESREPLLRYCARTIERRATPRLPDGRIAHHVNAPRGRTASRLLPWSSELRARGARLSPRRWPPSPLRGTPISGPSVTPGKIGCCDIPCLWVSDYPIIANGLQCKRLSVGAARRWAIDRSVVSITLLNCFLGFSAIGALAHG